MSIRFFQFKVGKRNLHENNFFIIFVEMITISWQRYMTQIIFWKFLVALVPHNIPRTASFFSQNHFSWASSSLFAYETFVRTVEAVHMQWWESDHKSMEKKNKTKQPISGHTPQCCLTIELKHAKMKDYLVEYSGTNLSLLKFSLKTNRANLSAIFSIFNTPLHNHSVIFPYMQLPCFCFYC